jgi:aspartyl/asparaginyl-tRNA synthetase
LERILTTELAERTGERVRLAGWLHHQRQLSRVTFLVLHEDYLAALAARGLDPAPFDGYLQAFRYGLPPHGGFAIGLERWVARLVGAGNIRETTLFPRDRSRLTP